jgi:hypothetical protein
MSESVSQSLSPHLFGSPDDDEETHHQQKREKEPLPISRSKESTETLIQHSPFHVQRSRFTSQHKKPIE